jgi:hypothetical protein
MADRLRRFEWVVRTAKVWLLLVDILLVLGFVLAALVMVKSKEFSIQWLFGLPWIVTFVGLAAAAFWVMVIRGIVETVATNEHHLSEVVDRLGRLESLTEAIHNSNARLVELSQMSEAAKSLIFREREIEAMNELTNEMLIRQDYAKAEALANDIEKRLGYSDQVQQMRKEIAVSRETTIEQKVDMAVKRVASLIEQHDWAQAARQANRLVGAMPDNARIAVLPQAVRDARAKYKAELLSAYGEAVKNSDIDHSIELLRELDKYLTPQEASALQDSARGVFRARLHNLGVQFAIRATEENWAEALSIGERIINEFPNSQMAQEVRNKMDSLRALALKKAQQGPAATK